MWNYDQIKFWWFTSFEALFFLLSGSGFNSSHHSNISSSTMDSNLLSPNNSGGSLGMSPHISPRMPHQNLSPQQIPPMPRPPSVVVHPVATDLTDEVEDTFDWDSIVWVETVISAVFELVCDLSKVSRFCAEIQSLLSCPCLSYFVLVHFSWKQEGINYEQYFAEFLSY